MKKLHRILALSGILLLCLLAAALQWSRRAGEPGRPAAASVESILPAVAAEAEPSVPELALDEAEPPPADRRNAPSFVKGSDAQPSAARRAKRRPLLCSKTAKMRFE